MKVYLVDLDEGMTSCWEEHFAECADVTVVNGDITRFFNKEGFCRGMG